MIAFMIEYSFYCVLLPTQKQASEQKTRLAGRDFNPTEVGKCARGTCLSSSFYSLC